MKYEIIPVHYRFNELAIFQFRKRINPASKALRENRKIMKTKMKTTNVKTPLLGRACPGVSAGWGRLFLLLTFLGLSTAFAQVGIGTETPESSAVLDLNSSSKGFLLPRITTSERDEIILPATSLMIYNTSIPCLQINDGTPAEPDWVCISNNKGFEEGSILTIDCLGATHIGLLRESLESSGVRSIVNYTGGAGDYEGKLFPSTSVEGLTAAIVAGTFADGDGSLEVIIFGTPQSFGIASFMLEIGGIGCTLEREVEAFGVFNICNPSMPTELTDVTNTITGRTWMDRNLGANRVALSPNDEQAYGSLYQWGRGSDGHQCVQRFNGDGVTTSGVTDVGASVNTDTPPHDNFILMNDFVNDWRNPANNNLWQGVNGINNPCPDNYRLPTVAELEQERQSWSQDNIQGAFDSPLKLTAAGFRDNRNGNISEVGERGRYWSSTISDANARRLRFASTSANMLTERRALGSSVRCIKEEE